MKAGRGIRSLGWAALLFGAVVCDSRGAEDGEVRLRYATGNSGTVKIRSSPAIDDEGNLYIGVYGRNGVTGRVLAIDPQRGLPKQGWSPSGFETPDVVSSSPTVGPDKTVYFGCEDGFVYALAGDTGKRKWAQQVGFFVTSSPTLSADGSVLYIGSGGALGDDTTGNNGLHALRTSDGFPLWTFNTKGEVESTPALAADGTLYFGSYDHNIYAVKSDGTLKWSQSTANWVVSSPAIGLDGTVYIGSYDFYLYALFPDNGGIKWRYQANNAVHASPVLGPDGAIFFGSLGNNFYALNPDGTERWSPINVASPVFSSAAVRSDGVVIFGADDGVMRAIYADSGAVKWSRLASVTSTSADFIDSSPVIARDGSVYVGSNDGNVYGFYGVGATSLYSRWPMFRHDLSHTGRATVYPEGGRLINLSTRAQAGDGKVLIAGLATSGGGAKNYLIRAAGPALAGEPFRVPDALLDPSFSFVSQGSNVVLFSNNDWGLDANATQIRESFAQLGAFPFVEGSKDAAALRSLQGGVYTAMVSGAPGTSGVALVEVYDADVANTNTRLINLSTRAQAGSGGDLLIAGLVIGGTAPVRVLVRGIGPELARFGVPKFLAKPSLSVFPQASASALPPTPFLTNEGWSNSVQKGDTAGMSKIVNAFPLPDGSADCAALVSLNPGAYTIQVSGIDNTTGEALVEVYLLP